MFNKLKALFKDKKLLKQKISGVLLVILGNTLIAFGSAIFLTKLSIVAGGVAGIGIIFQHFLGAKFGQVIDIVTFIFTWILWLISLFVLGKEFAFKTLLSAIVYPIILSIFLRVKVFDDLATTIAYYPSGIIPESGKAEIGNLLICALFSGLFIGAGVGLSFLGGGSSGGVDVIVAIIAKYTTVKESTASIIVDGIVILLAAILIQDVVPAMCGLVSATISAIMVRIVYVENDSSLQVDIISDKWEDIRDYAFDNLSRGATVIHAEGAYKGENRIILRIVFPRRQYFSLKNYIARVDPKAFVTFTSTNAVYGEGFKTNSIIGPKNNKK